VKKLTTIFLLLILLSTIVRAQKLTPPEFPGGKNALSAFLDKNLKSPAKTAMQGTVLVGFTVEKDGRLTEISVKKSLAPAFDDEALRVMALSPRWIPAMRGKQFIKSNYTIPIMFVTQDVKITQPRDVNVTIDEPVAVPGADTYDPNKIYTSVERVPQFRGGMLKFHEYIKENLKNEKFTEEDEGKVIISFVVELDGSLTDIHVVRRISAAADAFALKLLKKSPKWEPGTQNGRPVRVAYSVPVNTKSNI